MKYSILLVVLVVSNILVKAQTKETLANFNKLQWLTGTWNRANTKPGRTAHERWQKINDQELQGWGISMKGNDTLFVEKLKIIIKDNTIYYVADVPENKQPVYFTCTAISPTGFTFENPQHDFPKKIEYQLEGKMLKATISGNGKAIVYLFTFTAGSTILVTGTSA